jgi:TatD DNase family protein
MEVISSAKNAGVKIMVCAAFDFTSSQNVKEIAEHNDSMYFMAGYHPHESKSMPDEFFQWVREIRNHPKFVGVGEIGLDYFYDHSPRQVQQNAFATQIEFAKELKCPIVVHCRDAYGDALDIMKSHRAQEVGGIIHCFSGSWETAKQWLDMGFYISFAGPVTFSNAVKLREVAAKIPNDMLLSETDGPYLPPVPYRGKRNEPQYVIKVVEKLAEVRNEDISYISSNLVDNVKKLWNISV